MKVEIFKTKEDIAKKLTKELLLLIEKNENVLCCFPSGATPKPFFEELKKFTSSQISKLKFISLDEWIGIEKGNVGSCYSMIENDFFKPLNFNKNNVCFFNGNATNMEEEILRINNFIKENGGIKFTIVGIGQNGHIGLNEPSTPESKDAHVVDLEEITKEVAQKYFSSKTILNKGITLSLEQLANSEQVYLVATSKNKTEIIKKILRGNDENIPANKLLKSKNAYLFLDKELVEGI